MKHIILILISLFLFSCSKSKESSTRTFKVVNIGALVGDFPGGIFVHLEDTEGKVIDEKFTEEPYSLKVADGKWKVYITAFEGPSPYIGEAMCGLVKEVDLNSDVVNVQIQMDDNCTDIVYVDLLKKSPAWDYGGFDVAKFGP